MTMLFTPNSNSCWCYHQVKYLYLATSKIEKICKKKRRVLKVAMSLKNILLHCDAHELKAVQHTYLQQCYYLTSTLFFISQHHKMRQFMKSQFTFSYRLFLFQSVSFRSLIWNFLWFTWICLYKFHKKLFHENIFL